MTPPELRKDIIIDNVGKYTDKVQFEHIPGDDKKKRSKTANSVRRQRAQTQNKYD